MKEVLIKINRKIISGKSVVISIYKLFLESIYFWILTLFMGVSFLMYIPYLFYKIHFFLGVIFSMFSIFFFFTLGPAFYYKIKGIDFFNDLVNLSNTKNGKENKKPKSYLKPKITDKIIEELYSILNAANLLDVTLIGDRTEIDLEKVYSFEYIKSFIEDVSEKGDSIKKLYLSTNQKIAGYILFDVLRPVVQKDVKSFCHLIYYSQKKDFKKVNYESISDSRKRGIDPRVEALLPEFLIKVRFKR